MYRLILFFTFFIIYDGLRGQNIGLNFKLFDELARRGQLLSNDSVTHSLLIRPVVDGKSQHPSQYSEHTFIIDKNNLNLHILPFQQKTLFSGAYPYKLWNEGTLIPAKGIQTQVSAGVRIEFFNILDIQLRPEFYEGNSRNHSSGVDPVHKRRTALLYLWQNRIDAPDTFGLKAIRKLTLQQSFVRINLKNLTLGFSNENLWWGPGKYSSIIMSDNAEGFKHISLHTNRPLVTKIGKFEGQLIAGKLESTGITPTDSLISYAGILLYDPKPADWRYLSGISVNYQPKGIDGLYIGFNKVIYQYRQTAIRRNDYMPVFTNVMNRHPTFDARHVSDRMTSMFFRWVIPEGNTEFYMEFGRDADKSSLKDFFRNPQINSAYLIGFSKIIPLSKHGFIELNTEVLKLQQPTDHAINYVDSWYIHDVVRHGYTHNNEVIGASVGPGSNLIVANLNWVNNAKKIGLQFERITHNNDFNYFTFTESGNWENFWIDYTLGPLGSWSYKNVYLSWQVLHTWSFNYQWGTIGGANDIILDGGNDKRNLLIKTDLVYTF